MVGDLWPGLELRHLTAFRAVARTGSFAAAAKELGYTQPAVSQQLAALERIVGQRLVERSSGRSSAVTTEAGQRLLAHLDTVSARLATARSDLQALADGDAARLRVGAFQSVSARILPTLLQRLAEEEPTVRVELEEGQVDLELLDGLDEGRLDVAFVMLPVDEGRFETVEVLVDPYYLVAAADGPFDVEIASLAELKGVPLVGYRSCRSFDSVDSHLRAAGVEPTFVFRTDDNFAVKGLVEAGIGVALIPRLTLETIGPDGLRVQLVSDLVPPRRIAVAWSRHRALLPAHEQFVAITREAAVAPALVSGG
jgi:molybdate transport repressor ModE-like protein